MDPTLKDCGNCSHCPRKEINSSQWENSANQMQCHAGLSIWVDKRKHLVERILRSGSPCPKWFGKTTRYERIVERKVEPEQMPATLSEPKLIVPVVKLPDGHYVQRLTRYQREWVI